MSPLRDDVDDIGFVGMADGHNDEWGDTLSPTSVMVNGLEAEEDFTNLGNKSDSSVAYAQILYMKSDESPRGVSIITEHDLAQLSMEEGYEEDARHCQEGYPNAMNCMEAVGCTPACVRSVGNGRFWLEPMDIPKHCASNIDSPLSNQLEEHRTMNLNDENMRTDAGYEDDDNWSVETCCSVNNHGSVAPIFRHVSEN